MIRIFKVVKNILRTKNLAIIHDNDRKSEFKLHLVICAQNTTSRVFMRKIDEKKMRNGTSVHYSHFLTHPVLSRRNTFLGNESSTLFRNNMHPYEGIRFRRGTSFLLQMKANAFIYWRKQFPPGLNRSYII